MKFVVCNKETCNNEIMVEKSVWTGRTSLYINGKPMNKIGKNLFSYNDSEGKEKKVAFKGSEILGIELYMDGRTITILRKLNTFEIVLVFIPLILIIGGASGGVIGGVIAGVCAAIGMTITASFCRKIDNIILKLLFILGIYGIITLVYFLIAGLILEII
ncbi:MAG TPA: hypothetical protein GX692_03410 [Acholeplasmataceae bacterium]|nr:hypothetical protein [Acholeplasmataceae bacterium]